VLILAIGLLPPVQANELAAPKNGNPLWKISLSALRATVERPLFSASRRPPPPAAVRIVAPSLPPSQLAAEPDHPPLKLLGTIIGERKEIAVFLDDATKNMISLRIGQDHDGWTLY
jgi:general secretion pathway protein N